MNRDMLSRIGEMQERLQKAQEEVQTRVVEATAGGGAVKIEITGAFKVQSLKIDPEVVDPSDVGMLEDLVTAAVNEALEKVQALQAEPFAGLAGGLGLPNMPGLPGLGAPGGPAGGPAAPPPMNRAARRAKR